MPWFIIRVRKIEQFCRKKSLNYGFFLKSGLIFYKQYFLLFNISIILRHFNTLTFLQPRDFDFNHIPFEWPKFIKNTEYYYRLMMMNDYYLKIFLSTYRSFLIYKIPVCTQKLSHNMDLRVATGCHLMSSFDNQHVQLKIINKMIIRVTVSFTRSF